jgi:endonuclease III
MLTRAAAKREASLVQHALAASLSSPPTTPINTNDIKKRDAPANSSAATRKKRASTKTTKSAEPAVRDFDILPHGLGEWRDVIKKDAIDDDNSNGMIAPTPNVVGLGKLATPESSPEHVDPVAAELIQEELSEVFGQTREIVKDENDTDAKDKDFRDLKSKQKRAAPKKKSLDTSQDVIDKANELVAATDGTAKRDQKKKVNKYGLTPGISPYPNHTMPTPEACEEVHRLLSQLHPGVKSQPKVIPPPSMDVTGCGEVPDLLDAILRTLLSAATSANNSNLALKGLEDAFGKQDSGPRKGSIHWEVVYRADVRTIERAIKSGGLAALKSKNIKAILEYVYELNRFRRDGPRPIEMTQEDRDMEKAKPDESLLSMDHVFELTTDDAMEELTQLPGVGVKTASCVILFCMKRPSFAVDTHVWRHCKMLGWVPAGASRDKTFSHCEVRIPNHLKYRLHQLFLEHGKKCGRCKAKGSDDEYKNTICPIEHLVTRTERKRDATRKKRKREEDTESEEMMIDEDSE